MPKTETTEALNNNIDSLDSKKFITIKGARQHNLKNVSVAIPRKQLVVITGVSGSGKSSLAIDTLFAEGQRRYVESLSSYARQFLSRMDKPEVDYIRGLCPAIAIEQKVATRSARSTVGTLTEIYDYLRILFARIGRTFSPESGKEVKKDSVSDVVDAIFKLKEKTRLLLLIPLKIPEGGTLAKELDILLQKGFSRLFWQGELYRIEDISAEKINKEDAIHVLIDRLVVQKDDEELQNRCADSIQTAFNESDGDCFVQLLNEDKTWGKLLHFSNRFELDGILFEEATHQLFNFNSPFGACKKCEGFGQTIGIDEELVIPNKNLSVFEGAVMPWRGDKMGEWRNKLISAANIFGFPIHRPINELSAEEYEVLWSGNEFFEGIEDFFRFLEMNSYKMHYRVLMARFRGRAKCRVCRGSRLRKEASYVQINQRSIGQLVAMPIDELLPFFEQLKLSKTEQTIAKRLLIEIKNRLQFMLDVGLGYLDVNRLSSTLSGGETQRINLTRTLGSNLTGSMYILDEPSIGLHPQDTNRLIKVLKQLRDLGNTVIVVEHDEDIIRAADYIIDMGPLAGRLGGEVTFAGSSDIIEADENSLTGQYLSQQMTIPVPKKRRQVSNKLQLEGASMHNLKSVDITVPLNAFTAVTGVSGSGKTTLIKSVFYPALQNLVNSTGRAALTYKQLSGDWKKISAIEFINQHPLGRSSRSNPVTYVKAYDSIRALYSQQQLSKIRGYLPKHFSFNVEGGRCEACQGEGEIVVEMQFLADVSLKCEDCDGKRFKPETMDVLYKEKSIGDVLKMTVDESIEFFTDEKDILKKLQPLADVGLGYVQLGQSSSTLSGGEAQRVKLASFLVKGRSQQPLFFIFDEPTTGLHFHDIHKLLKAFDALIEKGHTVLVIEHNMDVVKCADWVIDLGPEGGKKGGNLVFEGTPEDMVKFADAPTANHLEGYLKK